jgi:hypothetical protein
MKASPLSSIESYKVVFELFASVRKVDVLQKSGKIEHNAGELTPLATTTLIRACGLTSRDTFVDVGSGIGNVVAQVALETNVSAVIGVEIREELARHGETLMKEHTQRHPQLKKVTIYPQDICAVDIACDARFRESTVLFCHNTLFKPEVLLELEKICCSLPSLRTVVLSLPFCVRHRASCLRAFCRLFRVRDTPLVTSVTFKSSASELFVYDRIK